jgi:hypothetical protein
MLIVAAVADSLREPGTAMSAKREASDCWRTASGWELYPCVVYGLDQTETERMEGQNLDDGTRWPSSPASKVPAASYRDGWISMDTCHDRETSQLVGLLAIIGKTIYRAEQPHTVSP